MIVSDIVATVAKQFFISYSELIGPRRQAQFTKARFAAAFVLHKRGVSLTRIGKHLGNRDHTTIMNAIDRAEYMMERDEDYKLIINKMVNLKHTDLVH